MSLKHRKRDCDPCGLTPVTPVPPTADWKYRHAGLMALSAIGEGCHQQMEAILSEIVSFVLLFCSDPVRPAPRRLVFRHHHRNEPRSGSLKENAGVKWI